MSHIVTASGCYFDFERPERAVVAVFDIAHALSNLCRFTGHCKEFYSVAQHAVLTSYDSALAPAGALRGVRAARGRLAEMRADAARAG